MAVAERLGECSMERRYSTACLLLSLHLNWCLLPSGFLGCWSSSCHMLQLGAWLLQGDSCYPAGSGGCGGAGGSAGGCRAACSLGLARALSSGGWAKVRTTAHVVRLTKRMIAPIATAASTAEAAGAMQGSNVAADADPAGLVGLQDERHTDGAWRQVPPRLVAATFLCLPLPLCCHLFPEFLLLPCLCLGLLLLVCQIPCKPHLICPLHSLSLRFQHLLKDLELLSPRCLVKDPTFLHFNAKFGGNAC